MPWCVTNVYIKESEGAICFDIRHNLGEIRVSFKNHTYGMEGGSALVKLNLYCTPLVFNSSSGSRKIWLLTCQEYIGTLFQNRSARFDQPHIEAC